MDNEKEILDCDSIDCYEIHRKIRGKIFRKFWVVLYPKRHLERNNFKISETPAASPIDRV